MDWSFAEGVLRTTKVPKGYEIMQLRREDVAEVVDRLRAWYPGIAAGAESCHLTPEFYCDRAVLADATIDRSIFPIVAKQGSKVVAMMTFEKDSHALTISCRVGAVAPEHRGSGLAVLGPMLLEKIGRAMGAELAYYFATLQTAHQQVLAERLRYRLVGIIPAFDRESNGDGEIKRVYEAIYAKVLASDDALAPPNRDALTPRTRAVWDAIFGGVEREVT